MSSTTFRRRTDITYHDFLKLPPLVLTYEGKEILLRPHVRQGPSACYRSEPLNLWVDTPEGKMRVKGRLTLECDNSRNWRPK